MKTRIGVLGSAVSFAGPHVAASTLAETAERLARVIAGKDVILLSGATTGIVYVVGKTAHDAGSFHVGISPGSNEREHTELYKLPVDACDALIYTGFGLKGRNVVLVRSSDIVLFVSGAMGSLNEFTIAHDEGKVIGCLTGTGGVADEADYLLQKFGKRASTARVFQNEDPVKLLDDCMNSLKPS